MDDSEFIYTFDTMEVSLIVGETGRNYNLNIQSKLDDYFDLEKNVFLMYSMIV